MIMILDGFGENPSPYGNAILAADTPNLDALKAKYPHKTLEASGPAVGLPEGQMGNSEVGHMNIGAGRIVFQDLLKISNSIDDHSFETNEKILSTVKEGETLHIMGLLSDGGVHSHISHLKAIIKTAKAQKVKNLYLHAFLDGRDVPPKSAIEYITDIENFMKEEGIGEIKTVSGRYYAMDRDSRWERLQLAYDALVNSKGQVAKTAQRKASVRKTKTYNLQISTDTIASTPSSFPTDPSFSFVVALMKTSSGSISRISAIIFFISGI